MHTSRMLKQHNGPLTFPDLADLAGACCHDLVHPLDHNTGLERGRGTGRVLMIWAKICLPVGYLI